MGTISQKDAKDAKDAKVSQFSMTIRLEREDGIPAFGGFLKCEEQHTESPVIFLNVQACMSPELLSEDPAVPGVFEPTPVSRDERKLLIITTLMHEFGHALESYFQLPVNEEAIEKACEDWEQKYQQHQRPFRPFVSFASFCSNLLVVPCTPRPTSRKCTPPFTTAAS